MPGLVHQHLADPSLPAGTTLEGLTLPRNHPRPVLDVLRTGLCMRHEKDPSDHDDHLEGRDLASVEELSEAPGDPQLENLVMTEEEQRDFETFTLASLNARRGKTSWKASQENTKFYSQAQQARHQSESLASEARSLGSVDQGQGQAQPLLVQAQAPAQGQPAGQDRFPVLLPQGQGRPLPVLARRDDLDSLFEDDNFSLDLDNEANLREKQAHSEALDKVAEFCKLDRQDSDAKREVMGMRLPVYNAPARKSAVA